MIEGYYTVNRLFKGIPLTTNPAEGFNLDLNRILNFKN
jgi:hypothetical protein